MSLERPGELDLARRVARSSGGLSLSGGRMLKTTARKATDYHLQEIKMQPFGFGKLAQGSSVVECAKESEKLSIGSHLLFSQRDITLWSSWWRLAG